MLQPGVRILELENGFFDKKLGSRLGLSYNQSDSNSGKSNVANVRLHLNYTLLKKHNFDVSAIQLFRSGTSINNIQELTATIGYSYSFGLKKPKFNFKENQTLRVAYKQRIYRGKPEEITPQLIALQSEFDQRIMPEVKKEELRLLQIATLEAEDNRQKRVQRRSNVLSSGIRCL